MKVYTKPKILVTTTAALASLLILLAFGTITAIIPNNLFTRMIPATILDYTLLAATSVLLGTFIALHFYIKSRRKKYSLGKEGYAAAGGTIPAIFAFSCPICNVLLVSLFGAGAVLAYFEPLRPLLGFFGVGILSLALYLKTQDVKSCSRCLK